MTRPPFIVWKKDYLGVVYLRLKGPFQYPSWEADQNGATPMSRSQAYAHAAVEGGYPLIIDDETMHLQPYNLGQRLLAKIEDKPPPSSHRWGMI